MTTDILYVTYSKDLGYFRNSLEVLKHNLKGYRDIHVVCPHQDAELVREIIQGVGVKATIHRQTDWPGRNYIFQQWMKINADLFSDAQYILHMDSDVFIAKPTEVSDYFVDGKPGWMWSWYGDIAGQTPWQEPTERALGVKVDREYMRAMPFLIHRDTYALTRSAMPEGYVAKVDVFSEFNVMGHVAFTYQQPLYTFIDRNRLPDGTLSTAHWPKGIYNTRHFWSHAPLEDHLPEIAQMITGGTEHQLRYTNMGICVLSNDAWISKWVEEHGMLDFDQPNLQAQCKWIKPGDVVVDAGAYIGDNTEAYAKATAGDDSGKVYAFEPNKMPFEALTRNMRRGGGHGHVECINAGLSDVEGEWGMAQSPNGGASHLTEGTGFKVTTLDSLGLERLDFLKIDVEGFEVRLLDGAKDTIARCRPVMFIEVNEGALVRQGTSSDALKAAIEAFGYRIEGWVGGEQFDVYAIPEER